MARKILKALRLALIADGMGLDPDSDFRPLIPSARIIIATGHSVHILSAPYRDLMPRCAGRSTTLTGSEDDLNARGGG